MRMRSYKYRCYPTDQQRHILARWQYAAWDVQRLCMQQRRIIDHQRRMQIVNRRISWQSQSKEITEVRRALYPDVPADMIAQVARRVQQAYDKAWENVKAGKGWRHPRWPRRSSDVGLLFRGQVDRGTRLVAAGGRHAHWQIAGAKGLGPLAVRMHRPLPDDAETRRVDLTCEADGWYISISCAIPETDLLPETGKTIGVDLNVKHDGDVQEIAALDDGRIYHAPDGLKRHARRLATYQRLVDRRRRVHGSAKAADPKSKRTAKRRARIAKLHQRITRQRTHAQQFTARRLVDTADVIAFENLNHVGMRRKGKGRRKRGLNRALSTAAPGKLIALTQEKAQAAGRCVRNVDPRNTTQICSRCGCKGAHKGLAVRRWTCESCGQQQNRDVNAARNIRQRAMGADRPEQPAFSGGLPGEGSAGTTGNVSSANLEAAHAAGSEGSGLSDTVPTPNAPGTHMHHRSLHAGGQSCTSAALQCKKHVAEQLSLFDAF